MCGIVGFVGAGKAAPIILDGLSRLEYRGYDSAGIVTVYNRKASVYKQTGKLSNLLKDIQNPDDIEGNVGIGHTRWATHGKPTKENAHPHFSERFFIVHNGIIENESVLRQKHLENVDFISDTDTEVIAHLLQKFTDNGESCEEAIMHIMAELEGSYALGIIDMESPDTLYAVKNKSPLLIGVGDDFGMIASDAMAMISKTNTFYEIDDMNYAVLRGNDISVYTSFGKKIKCRRFVTELDVSDVQKGAYEHYMLKEIEEQPAVIRRIINKYTDSDGKFVIDNCIENDFRQCDRIYFIACGTSYHAALVGRYYFEKIAGISAEVCIAGEFIYNMPLISENPLFVFVSQSGETADCRTALVKVKQMGYRTLTMTNVKGSTLSRESDNTLLLYAGPEIAVASTKAYTAQVSVMAIVAGVVGNKNSEELYHELTVTANAMDSLCNEKNKYKESVKKYLSGKRNCFYIGRSLDYYSCMEAALKLKEISYIQTEGIAAGELKHGTIALVEDGTPVFAIITQSNVNSGTRSNINEVTARGANVLCISCKSVSEPDDGIIIPDVSEFLSPLIAAVPVQYLAYYAALLNGCDIDKPRNLAKSVTVE